MLFISDILFANETLESNTNSQRSETINQSGSLNIEDFLPKAKTPERKNKKQIKRSSFVITCSAYKKEMEEKIKVKEELEQRKEENRQKRLKQKLENQAKSKKNKECKAYEEQNKQDRRGKTEDSHTKQAENKRIDSTDAETSE